MQLDSGLAVPMAIILSPDGLWPAVVERNSRWGYSYRVRPDDRVQDKQCFHWFHESDGGAGAWAMDRDDRPHAATGMGTQVFDGMETDE